MVITLFLVNFPEIFLKEFDDSDHMDEVQFTVAFNASDATFGWKFFQRGLLKDI